MNAQKLANDWNIDNQTMLDYMLAITGDDLDDLNCEGIIIDEDDIDRAELDAEQVSEILKLYVEDNSID